MEENKSAQLSKTILEMKFMKKTKERVDKEADDAEGQAMYAGEITDEMKKSGQQLYVNSGIVFCKDLINGRLSFGGMNPDVEKIMAEQYGKQLEHLEKLKETDVTDVEMAKGYSTLVNTMGNKFNSKKQRKKHV